MQEQLGRLLVETAAAAWSAPGAAPRQLERATVEVLAQVPLFATLSRRHLGRVADVASAGRYAAGTPLVVEGTPADAFYAILAGSARVDVPGQDVTLATGDFFGEMALVDDEPRAATVTALTDVLVLMIPRGRFLELLEAEPKVALAVMETLTRRLRAAQAPAAAGPLA
jgi:CRP-like cAMP-binding protein